MSLPIVAPLHRALQEFMCRRGIAVTSLGSDGRLSLNIDSKYRIHLRPISANLLALQAKVTSLQRRDGLAADDVLLRLMRLGSGVLQEHACTFCFEKPGQDLILQEVLDANTGGGEGLEAAIADFVNVLEFWTRVAESFELPRMKAPPWERRASR